MAALFLATLAVPALGQPFEIGPNWVSIGPEPIIPGAAVAYENILSPPVSGRASVLAVNPQNRYNVWLGTAGGGVWVTNNGFVGGLNAASVKPDPSGADFDRGWQPLWFPFSDGLTSLSIGAVVLDASRCEASGCFRAYVGTGENSLRRDTWYGDGIYRVELGGGEFPSWSWTRLDSNQQFRFGSTAALVLDGDELLVALAAGNTTTGLYATRRAPEPVAGYGVHRRDGSGAWTRIFETTSNGQERWEDLLVPTDLVKLPSGADDFLLGVMNDGLFRTTDRGQTWCALNPGSRLLAASQANQIDTAIGDCSAGSGLPAAGTFDHVELAVRGDALMAVLGNCPSGYTDATQGGTGLCRVGVQDRSPFFFKSSGGGSSWTDLGQITPVASDEGHYSRYTHALTVLSSSQALWGGLSPWLLGTAGTTLTPTKLRRGSLHYDVHDLAAFSGWDAGEGVVYAATDGGSYFLPTGASGWIAGNDSLVTSAFVDIALDAEDEPGDDYARTTAILGGLQDNSNAAFNGSPRWQLWGPVGDGGGALIQTPTVTYESIQDNTIWRRPGYGTPQASVGGPRVHQLEDQSFYSALVQHEETKRVFVATDVVSVRDSTPEAWDSTAGGGFPAAVQISPVLGTDGHDFPAVETDRDLITALAVAPTHGWRLYAGLYSGKLWRSKTDAATRPTPVAADWMRIDAGLPGGTISSIAIDPNHQDRLWVAFSDFLPQTVWFSDDAGASWQARSAGLPPAEPVKVIKTVRDQPGTLWLGTDSAVYRSTNGGVSWEPRTANLPRSPVFDLEVDHHLNRVFAATHGRGVWMFTEGGPELTTFEGWMEDGIWDIPIYGTGFECAQPGGCNCTVDVEREDGSVCATGTHDATNSRIFVPPGDHVLRTENQGSCTRCEGRPVVFACFNGRCVGGAPLSGCNQDGHRVSAVEVRCEGNPAARGSVAGFCPEQSNPPGNAFEVSPGLALPGTAGGGGPSAAPAPAPGAAVALMLTPTMLASPANGGDRALCSAVASIDPFDLPQAQLALRDAINDSPSCRAAGVAASVADETPIVSEDAPGAPDLQLALSAPGLTGTQMILGVGALPGQAAGLCFHMNRLGVYLGNQIAITQMTFPTGPGGAAGGELVITEASPVGLCTMRVKTSAGQSGAEIAAAVVQAFQTPGVPQPRTCPESHNPRDVTQDGAAVVSLLPTSLRACVYDEGVGFSFGPHGIPTAWPPPVVRYAAKVVCGPQPEAQEMRLARGFYATTINVHNPGPGGVALTKRLALSYPPPEQKQGEVLHLGADLLDPQHALKTDCEDLRQRLFPDGFPARYLEGFVVLEASEELDVTGVYTTAALRDDGTAAGHSGIDVEPIPGRRVRQGGRRPERPGGEDGDPDDPGRPEEALLCYRAESDRRVQRRVDLRTELGSERRVAVTRPLRWVCEPVFKAHRREDLPPDPPRALPAACYPIEARPVDRRIRLEDLNRFFAGTASVGASVLLCNPVQKLAAADVAVDQPPSEAHHVGFALEAPPIPPATVYTRDRWGVRELRFTRSELLLEPATKDRPNDPLPAGLPHHCYRVERGEPLNRPLRIVDQFGEVGVELREPELFCDPADRRVE